MARIAAPLLACAAPLLAAGSAAGFEPGSSSLGDPLFPQVGNGGYDVRHYDLDLRYDPASNRLGAGTRTLITAVARQRLSRFSLDFQRELSIGSVLVDGRPAEFRRRDAKPRLSGDPRATQPAKLVVRPPAGLPRGARFTVLVEYAGVPERITDVDGSIEGWIRACSAPGRCDGSFTVNEPIGAQSWFPCNNYTTDKATFTTRITTPDTHVALGAGELASRSPAAAGGSTWTWVEDDPMAPYLATGTVGLFDHEVGSMTEARTGAVLPIYDAIDSASPAEPRERVQRAIARTPEMLNFLSRRFGPYPFDSIGSVADWVPSAGYALENQTKPHYAGNRRGPSVPDQELLHEIAHQWFGNSVTGRRWTDIWFNEGWATFSEVYWGSKINGEKQSPREFFRAVHSSRPGNFEIAPTRLDGDPANLFDGFAVYNRPGAMIEGYREIVGNRRFFAFARKLQRRHAYSTISRGEFIREAARAGGLPAAQRDRLRAYFRQWLLRERKPDLTPADFRR